MTENELHELKKRFSAAAAHGGRIEAYGCIFHFLPTEKTRTRPAEIFDGSHSTVPGHLAKLNWSDLTR